MLFKNGISKENVYKETLTIKRYKILLKSHTNESFSFTRENTPFIGIFLKFDETICDDDVRVFLLFGIMLHKDDCNFVMFYNNLIYISRKKDGRYIN